MKYLRLLYAFFLLNGISFPQTHPEEFSPGDICSISKMVRFASMNYPGDDSYDVKYYKLDLNVSYNPPGLLGKVTVEADRENNTFDEVYLDLSNNLFVDSVISGNNSLIFRHAEDKLFVNLPGEPDRFAIDIYYHGVPATTGMGSFVFDSHNGQPSIWTLSEPYGAKDWWPCKDTPGDKADSSDVWITCSTELIGVSNGKLIGTTDNGNGTHTFKWKNSYPIAQYLISLAISNYTVYRQYFNYSEKDSMEVVHYIYPEDFDSLKANLDQTINILTILSDKFGTYPFLREKYGHAQFGRGGMEHQTISSMGNFNIGVIVHELAHQWFGDMVTCKNWENIWLNEGFATFSEALYEEAVSGKDGYNRLINSNMQSARRAAGSLYVQNINSISEIFSGARSYSKGSVVLHMLRGITGDEIFFEILRNYLKDPELTYGVAVTEDFRRVAENVYGSSLDYFFNEWIYGENYPKYNIKWSYSNSGNNFYNVKINVSQLSNSYPTYFTMPLQFRIKTNNTDTTFTLFNNMQDQEFQIVLQGEPVEFHFDPENLVLKDVLLEDPANFNRPLEYILRQNYPNPFNNGTVITFGLPSRSDVQLSIYDLLGNKVAVIYSGDTEAGYHSFELNTSIYNMAAGVYFYRLETTSVYISKKFILLK